MKEKLYLKNLVLSYPDARLYTSFPVFDFRVSG